MLPRLFVDAPLATHADVALNASQTHYLRQVLRLGPGAPVALFNGSDGEWLATIAVMGKKSANLTVGELTRPQAAEPAMTLMFAPLKRGPIDYLAEKATELGVTCLQPVLTRRTVAQRVNLERLRAHAVEAAEQCERLSVPEVREPAPLDTLLDGWPDAAPLLFCDERGGVPILSCLAQRLPVPTAILIGPEGGFDDRERSWLMDRPAVRPVSLGPRILRAETAAAAALAIWQAAVDAKQTSTADRAGN